MAVSTNDTSRARPRWFWYRTLRRIHIAYLFPCPVIKLAVWLTLIIWVLLGCILILFGSVPRYKTNGNRRRISMQCEYVEEPYTVWNWSCLHVKFCSSYTFFDRRLPCKSKERRGGGEEICAGWPLSKQPINHWDADSVSQTTASSVN